MLERILRELKSEQNKLERLIVQGQITDYASYKFLVGRAQGIAGAIEIIREVFNRGDNE